MESSFSFPCPQEQTVASALLLLSTSPPSLSPTSAKWSKSDDGSESLFASSNGNSKSCDSTTSSTVSSNDGSSPGIRRGRQLHMVAHVARCNDMMMKVVRKSRSKTFWISDCQKNPPCKHTTARSSGSRSEPTEASSCLSTGSSSVCSGQSCNSNGTKIGKEAGTTSARGLKRKPAGSGLLSGRSEAILKLLSNGCCISEVRIRQLLGDSPDTSKALRMLLRREEVRRSGAGGRTDPFIYEVILGKNLNKTLLRIFFVRRNLIFDSPCVGGLSCERMMLRLTN